MLTLKTSNFWKNDSYEISLTEFWICFFTNKDFFLKTAIQNCLINCLLKSIIRKLPH